ncbi:WD40-repeat-containing domain protein [Zopfochytrium polystomum]|nr:WD40-repeat-containing domain protein [Zopfochytrium polystomum]
MSQPTSQISFTSDDVNYLVYRYLLESGFTHTTFAFQQESGIYPRSLHPHNSQTIGHDSRRYKVPPGALINFLQKGLHYIEVETHTNEDGSIKKCSASFSLVNPHECESVVDDDGTEMKDDRKRGKKEDQQRDFPSHKRERKDSKRATDREKRARKESSGIDVVAVKAMVESESPSNQSDKQTKISKREISFLSGHEKDVFACAWNPKFPLLATSAGDGTARIWKVPMDASESVGDSILLPHESEGAGQKDVTTLDWHHSGSLLATGCYDEHARIWTKAGELVHFLRRHTGPIFNVRWNRKGDLLLSGSMDHTAIIWDATTGECRQQFAFHEGPVLDVDWKDDVTFATSSTDKSAYVCRMGTIEPVRSYAGHQNEVNVIRWDPTGTYLASCSDDCTAKVWTMESDSALWSLEGHTQEIYSIRWAPYPSSSASNSVLSPSSSSAASAENPAISGIAATRRLLATCSFDATIRIWDVSNGQCLFVLDSQHSSPIYTVSFSPDGLFLASGSTDKSVCIWRVKDGAVVRTYGGSGAVYEVAWNHKGDKLAVANTDSTVWLMHLPTLKDKFQF